jgi:hypothetical protein
MRWPILALAFGLAACASTVASPPVVMDGNSKLVSDRAEVEAAQRTLQAERRAGEDALELASKTKAGEPRQEAFEDLTRRFEAKEDAALQPLADRGNSEAQYRLSLRLRDAGAVDDVRRWFDLVNAAARSGHPEAELELNRWYWHQRDGGSIEDVQRNRTRSMAYAERAADEGAMFGIRRIAVYISGAVHQYPPNLDLARRLLELCAETDDQGCQEALVGGPYSYAISPARSYFWLHRLANRQPERYSQSLKAAYERLPTDEKNYLSAQAAAWHPTPWMLLKARWDGLRNEVLAYGATSVGPDAPCTTATPWCRGKLLKTMGDGAAK